MLTIGKLARQAGITTDAVRYYEKEGLLVPSQKTAAGYRLYGEDAARRLHFIKHAQQCGFSLAEIRELLGLKNQSRSCCVDVRSVAKTKMAQLESRIQALQTLSQALRQLIDICTDGTKPVEECPILLALEMTLRKEGEKNSPGIDFKRPPRSRQRRSLGRISDRDRSSLKMLDLGYDSKV